jgi:hypothetical protein
MHYCWHVVLYALQNLYPRKTPGPDNLYPRILSAKVCQRGRPILVPTFQSVIAFRQVTFRLEVANISFVFKKSVKSDISNYR